MGDRIEEVAALGSRLDARFDEARVEASLARLHVRSRRRRVRRVALAGALAVAVVGVIAFRSSLVTAPLIVRNAVEPAPRELRLHDGSLIRPEPGAEVAIVEDNAERVTLELSGAAAQFDILHNPARVLTVHVGPLSIVDLGTRFRAEPQGDRVHVAVQEGRVRVDGLEASAEMIAGEARWFSTKRAAALSAPEAPRVAPLAVPPVAAVHSVQHSAVGPAVDRSWRALAAAGLFDEAWKKLASAPPEAVHDEPEELMLAADVARLSGHPGEAIAPLEKVVHNFPDDARAPLAAFTMGKVMLAINRPADGARAFANVRALEPSGTLAEDALAREVEAWASADKSERVRERAREYLERYPHGAKAAAVRELLGAQP